MKMKRIAAASLGMLLTASAWAQHGGSAGHATGGFSSGRSFAAPTYSHSFGNAPSIRPSVSSRTGFQYSPAPFGGTYPYNSNGKRPPYRGGTYRPGYYPQGVYLGTGWLSSGYYGPGIDADSTASNDNGEPGGAPGPDAYPPQGGPDEQAYATMPARPVYQAEAASSPDLQPPAQITLIFKDGRPTQVVENYAVTRTTLYVLDGARRREIPLSQLDLSETEKANRDAGVDFEVPASSE